MKKPNARFTKKATIWGLVISALGVLGIGGWHIAPWVEASAFREHEAKNQDAYRMFASDLKGVASKTLETARRQTYRSILDVRASKRMRFRSISPDQEAKRQRDLDEEEEGLKQELERIQTEQKKYE